MMLATGPIEALVEAALRAGLDGRDRGAVRRLIWEELGTDAVDHEVVDDVAGRLRRLTNTNR